MRDWDYHYEFQHGELVPNDLLSAEQKAQHYQAARKWKMLFQRLRPDFDALFREPAEQRPSTFRNALGVMEAASQRGSTTTGKLLYDGQGEFNASRMRVGEFIQSCPPFRALVCAVLLSEYDLAISDQKAGQRFKAGRLDLFMSVYLPYCDYFVTCDEGQSDALKEIATQTAIGVTVLSYEELRLLLSDASQ